MLTVAVHRGFYSRASKNSLSTSPRKCVLMNRPLRATPASSSVPDSDELSASPAPAATDSQSDAAQGWDPYEVWRTRVLLAPPTGYKKSRGNP